MSESAGELVTDCRQISAGVRGGCFSAERLCPYSSLSSESPGLTVCRHRLHLLCSEKEAVCATWRVVFLVFWYKETVSLCLVHVLYTERKYRTAKSGEIHPHEHTQH